MIDLIKRIIHRVLQNDLIKQLKLCGEKVYFDGRFTVVGACNISLGDSIYIGPNATLIAADAPIIIKGHFMAGPGLTIITGGPQNGYLWKIHG